MIIAIDGPAGSGKTTAAKRLAQKLNIGYLDTGATYRALTLKALESGLDLSDSQSLQNLAKNLDIRLEKDKTFLDGKDVSHTIRTPRINQNISQVVGHPQVREIMVVLQRKIAENKDFVVEGRDITTVVFPSAEFKFYLDADFAVRVERRLKEFKEKQIEADSDLVEEDLKKRDNADMNREVGSLKVAKDAIHIDTTNLSIEEVVGELAGYVKRQVSK
ncbi:MAG: (d)CMP kinase [Candidatus Omnitrophota bacterium]|nr:MAG: (d)CMP kinase [Candidatus Omnitrophota bacterium]